MNSHSDSLVDEDRRQRFERGWLTGERPQVREYLPNAGDPRYAATLEELIAIDLEFRWRQSSAHEPREGVPAEDGPRLESYLAEFSLGEDHDQLARLVEAEIDARLQAGNHPAAEEFKRRFPELLENSRVTKRLTELTMVLPGESALCLESLDSPPAVHSRTSWMLRIVGTPYVYRPAAGATQCTVGRQRRRPGEPTTVGNDFVIRIEASPTNTLRISRRHFELQLDVHGLSIIDRSKNGTSLNGVLLPSGRPMPIRSGDHIRLGGVVMLELLVEAVELDTVSFYGEVALDDHDGHSFFVEATIGELIVQPDG